ncbi:MAG TPA: OsmC family protein [Candidatus Dormibacteraeota bacterium]|nr:OsmC family protein [Candidatus Dormibacteraeota bacterium]
MTGTLAGALEARGIDAGDGRLVAEAEGEVVLEDRVLVIKRIRVRYRLSGCPEDKREAAERAHAFHARRCPVARSIGGSIGITTELTYA